MASTVNTYRSFSSIFVKEDFFTQINEETDKIIKQNVTREEFEDYVTLKTLKLEVELAFLYSHILDTDTNIDLKEENKLTWEKDIDIFLKAEQIGLKLPEKWTQVASPFDRSPSSRRGLLINILLQIEFKINKVCEKCNFIPNGKGFNYACEIFKTSPKTFLHDLECSEYLDPLFIELRLDNDPSINHLF